MDRIKPIYLVISSIFPSYKSFRGPYIYDQVEAIKRDGRYNVVVLKPVSWLRYEHDYVYENINVKCFKHYDLPSNIWPGFSDIFNRKSILGCLRRLGIEINKISVVHAHITESAKYANFLKRLNPQIKTVVQHHGYDVLQLSDGIFANKKWHKHLCTRYGINECNQADLHLSVSNELFNYLESFEGIRLKNKRVLYNGVDRSKFFPIKNKVPNEFFTIGCVANFWEIKDQITLIRAVEVLVKSNLKNIKVKFVGSGSTRMKCEEYVKNQALDKYFDFFNEVDHSQLNDFYNSLDLFVLPSYWDSFGCVYVEAYSCGVPFMTAEGTGVCEIISESQRNHWVIKPHDFEGLANKIEKYIMSREPQILNIDLDINILVKNFLDYINRI